MIDPSIIVEEINRISNSYFIDSTFYLKWDNANKCHSTGNDTSKAINHHKNKHEEINAVRWFEDFWVYSVILFEETRRNEIDIFFSLSIFEGERNDNIKYQLFRAEWDNYRDNSIHPQPHWHFYPNNTSEGLLKDFAEFLEDDKSDFIDMIDNEKDKILNINKMHFAMMAIWNKNTNGHINKAFENKQVLDWYEGLLSHIKLQLEFAK